MKFPFAAFAVLGFLPCVNLRAQETMTEKPVAPATAGPAAATPETKPAKPLSRTEEILKRFDKNGDGKLDDDERADAHETMLQEQMAKGVNPAAALGLDAYQALALELFDRNHDGRIDESERQQAFAFVRPGNDRVLREAMVARFDKNKDGLLDEDERKESLAYIEEHRGELMMEILTRRFDKNANGKLDPEEKDAIREAFAKMPTAAAGAPLTGEEAERIAAQKFLQGEGRELMRAELLKRFDANGNGELDPEEQREAQQYGREHRGEIFRAVMLRRFDKNGDGRLDETERAAMAETMDALAATVAASDKIEEKKPLDPEKTAAIAAEIERRRAAREGRAPAPAPEEKK